MSRGLGDVYKRQLVPAEDAVHVDSTAHTIDEVVRIIEDLINQRR